MAQPTCDQIRGRAFRQMFDQEMSIERLASLIAQAHGLSTEDLSPPAPGPDLPRLAEGWGMAHRGLAE